MKLNEYKINLSKSGIEYLPPCGICQFAIKSIIIDSEINLICTCMYLVWLTFSEMQNITLIGYKNEISMLEMFSGILDGIQSCPKAFPKASNLF